jgi:hypothetical protein
MVKTQSNQLKVLQGRYQARVTNCFNVLRICYCLCVAGMKIVLMRIS